MKRRNFIKTVIPVGFLAGSFIGKATQSDIPKDIVIVKDKQSYQRFQTGIENCGGISRFVKKGQRVVIKPTIAYNQAADSGYNSDPLLIKELIEQCYEAGAKVVSVFDHTIDNWTECYKNSGIERVAKDARARVLPANHEMFYSGVTSENPKILKSVKIHNALLKIDVFINVAAARIDEDNSFFGSVKNLSGCIWERGEVINSGNDTKLAELLFYLKPDLTIVDTKDFQVISTDCIAADFVVLQRLNLDPYKFKYLKIADDLGFWDSNFLY